MSNMYDGKRMIINREPQRIDLRTDFGKGITFKSDDGHEHASMKDANKASQEYWDRMMNDTSKKDYMHYTEIEKAYFDCITLTLNISDPETTQKFLAMQQKSYDLYQRKI